MLWSGFNQDIAPLFPPLDGGLQKIEALLVSFTRGVSYLAELAVASTPGAGEDPISP